MARWVSITLLLIVIAATSIAMYKVMSSFLLPLFLALVLAVIFNPVHHKVLERFPKRSYLAAGITTMLILLVVLVPFFGILALAVHDGLDAMRGNVLDEAVTRAFRVRDQLGLSLPMPAFEDEHGHWVSIAEVDAQIDRLPDLLPPREDVSHELSASLEVLLYSVNTIYDSYTAAIEAAEQETAATPDTAGSSAEPDGTSINAAHIRRMIKRGPEHVLGPLKDVQEILQTVVNYIAHDQAPVPLLGTPDADAGADTEAPRSKSDSAVLMAVNREYSRLHASYQSFQIHRLGGPLRAYLIALANPSPEQIEGFRHTVQRYLRSGLPLVAGQATAVISGTLFGLCIMVLALYYFLKDGPSMIRALMQLSPLEDRHELELLKEFDAVSRAVVLATLLSAVAQAALSGVAFFVLGFEPVFLLTMLTLVLSLVPFIGAAAVWFPACLWLALIDQRYWAAGLLFAYGFGVISMADNIVKPYVLAGHSKLHPLLGLLSVLGGVSALGPIGILVGPMVVSFLQALLNILNQELNSGGASKPVAET